MPNKASAKKALRQDTKRAAANNMLKRAYKNAMKDVEKTAKSGGDVAEKLRLAQKKLGKAVKNGVIKKNAGARKLSRLTKRTRSSK